MTIHDTFEEKNKSLYGIGKGSLDYFNISNGNLSLTLPGGKVSFHKITKFITDHNLSSVTLRVPQLIDHQLRKLYTAFHEAINLYKYKGNFKGVFPVKVSHKAQILQTIAKYGAKHDHGWEIGTKAELLIVLNLLNEKTKNTLVICNGTKDADFIEAVLQLVKRGYNILISVETKRELQLIIQLSAKLDIIPSLALRFKMSQKVEGHWGHSSGLHSKFGLPANEISQIIQILESANFLSTIQMIHGHIGSQINKIDYFKRSAIELMAYFQTFWDAGCKNLRYLNLGGGLGIDYDGNQSTTDSSISYSFVDFANTIVNSLNDILLKRKEIPAPSIIIESGRAIVAASSMVLVQILENKHIHPRYPHNYAFQTPKIDKLLTQVQNRIEKAKDLEILNKLLEELEFALTDMQMEKDFWTNSISREDVEYLLAYVEQSILQSTKLLLINNPDMLPKSFQNTLPALAKILSRYSISLLGNFSVFNSALDYVLTNQYFPIIPTTGLNEQPETLVNLVDITCDSDGEIGAYNSKLSSKNEKQKWNPEDWFTKDGHLIWHPNYSIKSDGVPIPRTSMSPGKFILIALTGAYLDTVQFDQNLLGKLPELEINWEISQSSPLFKIRSDAESNSVLLSKMDHSVADILSKVLYEPKLQKLLYNNPYMQGNDFSAYDSISVDQKTKNNLQNTELKDE